MPSDAPGYLRVRSDTSHVLGQIIEMGFSGVPQRKDVWRTLESWLNGGGRTEEREYHSPPSQRRVPATALRDRFLHCVHSQGTALRPSRQRLIWC